MRAKKIGAIDFLNAQPIFYGLKSGLVPHQSQIVDYNPAESAQLLLDGKLDIAIIPSVLFANSNDLVVLPGVSIASQREVGSVNLYSNKELHDISTIAVDDRSRTSVALLRILCCEYYDIKPKFVTYKPDVDEMLTQADACLMIGDQALYYDKPTLTMRDLASDWYQHTGLPFVFAFLAGRKDTIDAEDVANLQMSLKLGKANVQKIAENYPSPQFAGALARKVHYLTENISYSFGENEVEALKLFYIKAWEHGIIESLPSIEFYEQD